MGLWSMKSSVHVTVITFFFCSIWVIIFPKLTDFLVQGYLWEFYVSIFTSVLSTSLCEVLQTDANTVIPWYKNIWFTDQCEYSSASVYKNQFMNFHWIQDAEINICFSVESQCSPLQSPSFQKLLVVPRTFCWLWWVPESSQMCRCFCVSEQFVHKQQPCRITELFL